MSEARRAIEALRAGVPNRSAIRLLGTAESEISERFLENLHRCRTDLLDGDQPLGQVLAGGFGAGKSHLLGYLQEMALTENFIVSWVAISKETPLFDLNKLYVAALRNATVPDRNEDAMTAVMGRLRANDAFDELRRWAESPEARLSPLFPALLHLHPHLSRHPERVRQVERFLAGAKLNLAEVKQWLREVGASKFFPLKPIKQPELVRQRLQFVTRLIAAAGYNGWVVLLDEVELIGRYSILQRGRSYAELARWLGLDAEEKVPGVVAVAAITDDFKDEVIGKRRDDEQVPFKLANKNERKVGERARLGISALEKQVLLRSPSAQLLQASLHKTRGIYGAAYSWEPPEIDIGEITAAKTMRQYIKSWITAWDIERLHGVRSEIETTDEPSNYEENTELERAVELSADGVDDE